MRKIVHLPMPICFEPNLSLVNHVPVLIQSGHSGQFSILRFEPIWLSLPDSDFDLRGAHVLPMEQVVGLVKSWRYGIHTARKKTAEFGEAAG
jgi:hypothetical protein